MSRKINNVLRWLEDSAGKYPDKTVFADENVSVTYSDFIRAAKETALNILGSVPPRAPVAVLGTKSVEVLTAFFGCAYAGCFYVPLNPAHPAERREKILSTLGRPVVLFASDAANCLPLDSYPAQCMPIYGKAADNDFSRLDRIRSEHIDTDPLYVIFTSGSTGEPKGIAVSHRSVIDFIEEFTDIFDIGPDEVIGNQAPFDFDVSVKDIYSTVRAGATMQIIPKQKFSFPVMLIDHLCERKITTLIWAVSAMCILSGFRAFTYKVPSAIRKIMFSGEAMPVKQLNAWKKYYPDAMFVNLYGPTEITCNCTYFILEKGEFKGDVLPIGKPFPNERIYLIDNEGNAVSGPHAIGEICVGGTALSLGYYNDPDGTKKAFVRNPSVGAYEDKIYKTGDLGFYGDDGLLYFVGRKDFQIKHMGHRIELGEIEAAAQSLCGVSRAVCMYDGVKKKIYGFYQGTLEVAGAVNELREKLPSYMIPQMIKLEKFPLTENGKVDRKALGKEYIK